MFSNSGAVAISVYLLTLQRHSLQGLFFVVLSLSAILAGLQIGRVIRQLPMLRLPNLYATPGVALFGFVVLSFAFFRWRPRFTFFCFLFNLCAIANGVLWALDTNSCLRVSHGQRHGLLWLGLLVSFGTSLANDLSQVLGQRRCDSVTASTALVLLCVPFSLLHLVALKTSA